MSTNRTIFFEFAGREANLAVQRPHIERLLAEVPDSFLHLWDLTREASDSDYIRRWAESNPQITYVGLMHPGHPYNCLYPPALRERRRGEPPCYCMKHKPPYEAVWKWYRDRIAFGNEYLDTDTFVKIDDDVLWLDSTERFNEMMTYLNAHPNYVLSANVANNAVCARHEDTLADLLQPEPVNRFGPADDQWWWRLHTDPQFAATSLTWLAERIKGDKPWPEDRAPWRTRAGENVSINMVAMKYPVLRHAAERMGEGRYGDEGTIDAMQPWVYPNFRAAHLSFGPQERDLGPDRLNLFRKMFKEN